MSNAGQFMPRHGWLLRPAFIALLAMFIAGCDRFTSDDTRLERARTALAAGETGPAIFDLKTVLKHDAKRDDARIALARAYFHATDLEAAKTELDRLTQASANTAELAELRCKVLLARGEFEEVLQLAQEDRAMAEVTRLTCKAAAERHMGKIADARASIDAALKSKPDDYDTLVEQVYVLVGEQKPGEAERSIDALLERHHESAEVLLLKGRFRLADRNYMDASQWFAKANRTSKRELSALQQVFVLSELGSAQLAAGEAEAAAQTYKEMKTRFPNSVSTYLLQARLAVVRNDHDEAAAALQRVIRSSPDHVPAQLLLGSVLIRQGKLEQAEADLSRLIAKKPDNVEARKLLASIHLSRNDAKGARQMLSGAGAAPADDSQFDWLMGAAMLQSGEAGGVELLEKSLAKTPTNRDLRLQVARTYLRQERREDALRILDGAPDAASDRAVQQLRVVASAMGKKPLEAGRQIDALAREDSGNAALLAVAGGYLAAIGNLQAGFDYLAKSIALDPKDTEARFRFAEVAAQRQEFSEAVKQLKLVVAADAKHQGAYLALASLAQKRGNLPEAKQYLERAIAQEPAAVNPRLMLAQIALAEKDLTRANALADQAAVAGKNRGQILNTFGQMLQQAGQLQDALRRFQEAEAAGVDRASLNAARVQFALGHRKEARAALESTAGKRTPMSFDAELMLAQLDVQDGDLSKALQRVEAWQHANSGNPAITAMAGELKADLYMSARKFGEAVKFYEQAGASRKNAGLAVKRFEAKRAAAAPNPEAALLEWLADSPYDNAVRLRLASHYDQIGRFVDAVGQYELIAQQAPEPIVLNNLAWGYFKVGDARALDTARRAYEAAPTSAEIGDTYGWVLAAGGKLNEALPLLQKSSERAPDNPEIRYHVAVVQARIGQREQASSLLREILNSKTDFSSRSDAQKLLNTLAKT